MIGFDLQEVERVKNADKLLQKIALESEIDYINRFANKTERVAALWAVKEATFKALDLSQGEISYKEIKLCHKDSGVPYIVLSGHAKERFDSLGATQIEVSISHQKSVAGAVVEIR